MHQGSVIESGTQSRHGSRSRVAGDSSPRGISQGAQDSRLAARALPVARVDLDPGEWAMLASPGGQAPSPGAMREILDFLAADALAGYAGDDAGPGMTRMLFLAPITSPEGDSAAAPGPVHPASRPALRRGPALPSGQAGSPQRGRAPGTRRPARGLAGARAARRYPGHRGAPGARPHPSVVPFAAGPAGMRPVPVPCLITAIMTETISGARTWRARCHPRHPDAALGRTPVRSPRRLSSPRRLAGHRAADA
jgi:hypothetical protein